MSDVQTGVRGDDGDNDVRRRLLSDVEQVAERKKTEVPYNLTEAGAVAYVAARGDAVDYELSPGEIARSVLSAVLPLYKKQLLDAIDACMECGKIHEHRIIERKANGSPLRGSWADPDDGHSYVRDEKGVLRRMRDEYE